jgi:hypothetical protein
MTQERHDSKPSELFRVDRTVTSLGSLGQNDAERRAYWHSRTPAERFLYMEHLRHVNYGSAALQRLQRVLELVEPGGS